jgi:large subunit ribosomal protein L6
MSRIGRAPIAVPAGVEVKIDGSTVTVKGAKGTLTRTVSSNMNVTLADGVSQLPVPNDQKENVSFTDPKNLR